jgi:hypothetical protein
MYIRMYIHTYIYVCVYQGAALALEALQYLALNGGCRANIDRLTK